MTDDTFEAMLHRAAKRFTPNTLIDLGASDGRWSAMAHAIWPKANLLLIEANHVHGPGFARLCEANLDFALAAHYRIQFAAGELGKVDIVYNDDDPFQGLVSVNPGDAIQMTTVDHEVSNLKLPGPYLIKFDTHGREHEILSGATQTLRDTYALIIEVYVRSLGPESLNMHDLCEVIDCRYGFLPTDWCEPLRRPFDERMHQVDMLFEREDAPGMSVAGYR